MFNNVFTALLQILGEQSENTWNLEIASPFLLQNYSG